MSPDETRIWKWIADRHGRAEAGFTEWKRHWATLTKDKLP